MEKKKKKAAADDDDCDEEGSLRINPKIEKEGLRREENFSFYSKERGKRLNNKEKIYLTFLLSKKRRHFILFTNLRVGLGLINFPLSQTGSRKSGKGFRRRRKRRRWRLIQRRGSWRRLITTEVKFRPWLQKNSCCVYCLTLSLNPSSSISSPSCMLPLFPPPSPSPSYVQYNCRVFFSSCFLYFLFGCAENGGEPKGFNQCFQSLIFRILYCLFGF